MIKLSRLNPLKKFKDRINKLEAESNDRLKALEKISLLQNKELLKLKKKVKSINREKINIVFVCHRPQVWGALKTLCESCIDDSSFNVTIVAIPNKEQLPGCGLVHEKYISEKAEDFFKNYPCTVINGYNYKTNEWIDLKILSPDCLFFQTPYNICRPPQYNSSIVSRYTLLCYVPYAYPLFGRDIEDSVYPESFFKDVHLVFVHNTKRKEWLLKHFDNIENFNENNIFVAGYPKLDCLEKYKNIESDFWKHKNENRKFRIIWTPRWCTTEGNCHFFEYEDLLFNYAYINEDVEIIFRPHPQMWQELVSTREMSLEDVKEIKHKWNSSNNTSVDETFDYLDKFYSSDLLITDSSTIVGPYILTKKPIIYCYKTDDFNEEGKRLSRGFYFIHSWNELKLHIEMLKNKQDTLGKKRERIIQEEFYLPKKGAGFEIKEYLKEDWDCAT
jgi:hypothetical protein